MIKSWNSIKEYSPAATEKTVFNGRTVLYTDITDINSGNIISVLNDLIWDIYENYRKVKMLKNYEKGVQPILQRDKKVRADINNRVVVNHAHEIKEFKKGFIFGDPVTYVQRARNDIRSNNANIDKLERETDIAVAELNEMMFEQGKSSKDIILADEFLTCGTGYRLALPSTNDEEVSPFKIYPLQSEYTFVVYSNDVFRRKVLAGTFVIKNTGVVELGCYTNERFFLLEGNLGNWKIIKDEENGIGIIPIVEYCNNNDRMGAFEPVIRLINAINLVSSDRVNGIAQFIQAILWINNCKLSDEQFEQLMLKGCIQTTDIDNDKKATIEWLATELNQTNTQTVVDDLTEKMLEIAGVPGREQSTGGNTGQAIMLSNGWQIAETQAQAFEEVYKEAELHFIEVVLKIIQNSQKVGNNRAVKNLKLSDIETRFNRSRTDNLLTKTQALQSLLEAGVHPRLAFKLCGLFSDSEQAYIDSAPYLKKWQFEAENDDAADGAEGNKVPESGEKLEPAKNEETTE